MTKKRKSIDQKRVIEKLFHLKMRAYLLIRLRKLKALRIKREKEQINLLEKYVIK